MLPIANYMEKFDEVSSEYEKKLTLKAEEVTEQLKEITLGLLDRSVDKFSIHWEEDLDGEFTTDVGLAWDGSKVLFIFEGEGEVLLGSNRELRVDIAKHFKDFLDEGLQTFERKLEKL